MVRQIRLVSEPGTWDAAEDRCWLASQGLTPETLPRRATWYRADRLPLRNLPTDPYHRRRYRERGWALKPPHVVKRPEHTRQSPQEAHTGHPEAEEVLEAPPAAMQHGNGKVRGPRLVRPVLQVMDGRDDWEGTATELMALVDPHAPPGGRLFKVAGMPLTPARLSRVLMGPRVSAALGNSGITVARGYRGHERVLRLSRR